MDAKPSLDAPELLPFVPMVYVAWADGDLSNEEIGSIRSRIAGEALPTSLKQVLHAWLDPQNPPSTSEVHRLRERLRRAKLDFGQRRRLSELGEAASFSPRPTLPSVEDPSFEPAALTRLLDGEQHSLQQEVRAVLSEPRFRYRYDLSRSERRAWVLSALQDLGARGWGALGMPEEAGGEGGIERFIAVFEILAHHDLSLLVKFGVQFGLFGGSVQNLGTKRHYETLRAIGRCELLGCFAMTEIGHGSNVREIESTATWRGEDGVFVIHSPSDGAGKNWVGNAAEHGRLATVFAQLEIDGEGYGVHAFLVPIRDEAGAPLPGVRLEDNGPKMGGRCSLATSGSSRTWTPSA
jgi:acyl-CoA oxidase